MSTPRSKVPAVSRPPRDAWLLHALMDTASEGLVAVDSHGTCLVCNRPAADMLGLASPEAAIGRPLRAVMGCRRRDEATAIEARCRGVAAGVPEAGGAELRRADGGNGPIEYRIQRLPGEQSGHAVLRLVAPDDTNAIPAAEKGILKMIAAGSVLPEILNGIVRAMERLSPTSLGSILLLDKAGRHLRHGAAPNLPDDYNRAIDGLAIGPEAGACGTAAYIKKQVVTADIAQDPLWRNYRQLALAHGLGACWSTPVVSADDKVLGTFAIYFRAARKPSQQDFHIMERMTHLIGVAIERTRGRRAAPGGEQRYRSLAATTMSAVWTADAKGSFIQPQTSWQAYTGQAWQDHQGWGWAQMLHPQDRERARQSWHKALAACGQFELKGRLWHAGSHQYHVVIAQAAPVRNRDGSVREWIGTVTDIEARGRAEQALSYSEERFQCLINATPTPFFISRRADGEVLLANELLGELYNISSEELVGTHTAEYCRDPADRDRMLAILHAHGHVRGFEAQIITSNGNLKWVSINAEPMQYNGESSLAVGVFDLTARKRAVQALEASESRYRFLYDNNPAMVLMLDQAGEILSVNAFGAEELGYEVAELLGRPFSLLFSQADMAVEKGHLQRCFQQPNRVHRWEIRRQHKDGSIQWVRENARVVDNADGQPSVLIACEDATEAHDLSEKLSYQASHDAMTGLFNRREFEQQLQCAIDTAKSENAEHALCYLDLDQFKIINDTCGHVVGDELLRQVSTIISDHVRRQDTLARLGGDEFGILMEHCPLEQAKHVAGKLQQAIEEFRFVWEQNSFNVGVSIGITPINDASAGIDGVLSSADSACYAAKEHGRNRIHAYQEDDTLLVRRFGEMQWVARINRAFDEGRFYLDCQSISPLAGPAVTDTHYEVLIRLQASDGEIVPPGAFLPAAERYNLATRIDRWVVSTTLQWLSRHPEHTRDLEICAINLSGRSLADKEFFEFILKTFRESGVNPKKICFEITETAAISNLREATRFIGALKKVGCRFSLDDFGSGLSSFAYLKNLPVDYLKIDGLFVKDIVEDPIDFAMVKSINEIGHVMGKRTVAEFVESEAILARLREIGVDYVQGYTLGEPRPLSELA